MKTLTENILRENINNLAIVSSHVLLESVLRIKEEKRRSCEDNMKDL
jgi:hypothetical protein